MSALRLFAALVLCFVAIPAAAQIAPSGSQIVASADSPSHVIHVDVTLNGEGRVGYIVSRQGKPVIAESRLGFLFTDAPQLLRNFVVGGKSTRSFDETWEEPWGEYRTIRNHYNELSVSFDESKAPKRRMTVVFRLFDDGIGFRYELPSVPGFTHANIADELTEFNIAEDGTAWWDEGREWNRAEYLYRKTPIEEIGFAQTPLTMRTKSGLHLSIHEAALIEALQSGRIHGAALDVFETEPLPAESPLWGMENVLISAHTADHTKTWLKDAVVFFMEQFERWKNGQPLKNIVDKRAGY